MVVKTVFMLKPLETRRKTITKGGVIPHHHTHVDIADTRMNHDTYGTFSVFLQVGFVHYGEIYQGI